MTDEQHMQKAREIVGCISLGLWSWSDRRYMDGDGTAIIASALSEAYRSGVEDGVRSMRLSFDSKASNNFDGTFNFDDASAKHERNWHMYMQGIGVLSKTDELVDKLWVRLILGFSGCYTSVFVLALVGLPLWAVFSISGCFMVPWAIAAVRLRRHIWAMQAETAKSGSGWARN